MVTQQNPLVTIAKKSFRISGEKMQFLNLINCIFSPETKKDFYPKIKIR